MITVKIFSKKISAWLGNRESAREWFQVSDSELRPIRIRSSNIEDVVRLRDAEGRMTKLFLTAVIFIAPLAAFAAMARATADTLLLNLPSLRRGISSIRII